MITNKSRQIAYWRLHSTAPFWMTYRPKEAVTSAGGTYTVGIQLNPLLGPKKDRRRLPIEHLIEPFNPARVCFILMAAFSAPGGNVEQVVCEC